MSKQKYCQLEKNQDLKCKNNIIESMDCITVVKVATYKVWILEKVGPIRL